MTHRDDFRSLGTHPYNIMMILLLASLTMIFIGLSGAYLYSRFQAGEPPIKIPFIFVFNTFILAGSSVTLDRAKKAYLSDQTLQYQRMLVLTVLLTMLFMVMQYVGWNILLAENPQIGIGNMRGYVYAISIIHLCHILAGLPFLLAFLYVAIVRMKEPVSVFVYFSDPLKQLKLKMLSMYWHFLDILWIYLVVFFYVNYFLK